MKSEEFVGSDEKQRVWSTNCLRAPDCVFNMLLVKCIQKEKWVLYLQRWEASCLCKDLWERDCWPGWTFPGRTPLHAQDDKEKRSELHHFVDSRLLKVVCKSGFTCNHKSEVESLLDWLAVHLVGQSRETHIFLVLILRNAHRYDYVAVLKRLSRLISPKPNIYSVSRSHEAVKTN